MKILVLYGPNLNLLGWMSRNTGSRLTLDRLNRSLRRKARELDVELKILQTQSESDASKLLQGQRNKVSGVLLVPGIWSETGRLLQETLAITGLPLAAYHLEPGPGQYSGNSIFRDTALLEQSGSTIEELVNFLKEFVRRLQ